MKAIRKLSTKVQNAFWKIGIPWHNPITDECTPDFNCCIGKIRAQRCSEETPIKFTGCINKKCKDCDK